MDQKVAGLLGANNPTLMGLLGNPMMQVGMGLLASRANPRINPFEAAMTGMTNAAQFRQIEEDRKREMEERERMDKVREQLSKIIPSMFSTRVEGPPTPDGVVPTQISPMGQAIGEVAQLDPLGAFDMLTRMQSPGADMSMINPITPGHYTPESVQAFQQSMLAGRPDYSLLKLYAPNRLGDVGGVPAVFDPVSGGMIPASVGGAPVTPQVVGTNQGTAQATAENIVAGAEQQRNAPRDVAAADARIDRINSTMQEVDKAIGQVSIASAGPGSVTSFIPGAPARDLRSTIQTIKANIGFSELQAMREASPTGGALGQVAVQELEALQSVIASLDERQSPDQLRGNLQKIKQHYTKWAQTVAQSRDAAAGRMDSPPPQPPAQDTSDPLGIRR
jgi:hypothetical protein